MVFTRKIRRKIEPFGEHFAERFFGKRSKRLERVQRKRFRKSRVEIFHREAEQIVKHRAAQNSVQNSALYFLLREYRNQKQRNHRHNQRHHVRPFRPAEQVERSQRYACGRIGNHQFRVLQTEKRDKQADAGGNRFLHCGRNRFEYDFAQSRYRKQDENNAVKQDEYQRVRIRKSQRETHRVYEKRVQSHAGSLRQRQICKQPD